MITPKIKALFQFIEYLHSNIENFNQYNDLIKELESLNKVRSNLKPEQNYKDRLQYNKIQAEIENKFKTLQHNTANLIKAKAKELNVCSFENEPRYNFNGVETEIRQLKENFSKDDLPEIFKHKSQYLEYRSNTHGTFLSLQFFFDELDEITKSLFDYFKKDTEQNEFEAFETKAIPVNSIAEAIKGFKKGQTKFTLPNSFLFNTSTNEQPQNEALPPQQNEEQYFNRLRKDNMESFYSNNLNLWIIQNSEYTEFNDKPLTGMEKEIRAVTNYLGFRNDNIATSKNDTSGFKIYESEFIEYEKDKIISLLNNSTNSQLKRKLKHYLKFINDKEPQPIVKQKPELKLNEFFIKEVSSDTIEAIQTEFRELEGKELAILIYLLHKEHKIIEILTNSRTKGRKGFVKCLKEIDNPTMQKVNKCFTPNTDDLIYSKDDLVFQSLNKRLTKIIKN